MEGSLTGEFYFIVTGNPQITVQQVPANAEAAAWQAADSSNTVAAFEAYLVEYPSGLYAAAARIKLASLKAAVLAANAAAAGVAATAAPSPAAPAAASLAAPAAASAPGSAAPPLLTPVPPGTKDADGFVWRDVQAKGGKEHYEAYLQQFPKGRYIVMARAALKGFAQREAQFEAQQRALAEPQGWEAARLSHTEEAYRAYLLEYPKGQFVAQANAAIITLRQQADAAAAAREPPRAPEAPSRAAQERPLSAAERQALHTAAVREMKLASLTGAEFQMGAEADELGEGSALDVTAQPRRSVKVANFELANQEVTVAQFRKFADATGYLTEAEGASRPGCFVPAKGGSWVLAPAANWRAPGFAQTDSFPVVCVSWNDALAYLVWLNSGGERFRLPSEAEWEFAARAGTATPRPWSDSAGFFSRTWNTVKPWSADRSSRACKYANVADESMRKQFDWPDAFDCNDGYAIAVPGGYFGRNNFGLYDMMGNAAEWTQDCWNASHAGAPGDARPRSSGDCTRRVVRGGSWASSQASIRSAARLSQPQSYRAADLGLRLARSPKQ